MNSNFVETEAIKNLLDRYGDAVYSADIDALKTIFHEKASMNGYLGPDMLIGTPEMFFADLGSKPSMKEQKDDFRCVLTDLRVTGSIAEATLFVDNFYGAACIEDHFHLIKDNGEWKIVCKTFTTL